MFYGESAVCVWKNRFSQCFTVEFLDFLPFGPETNFLGTATIQGGSICGIRSLPTPVKKALFINVIYISGFRGTAGLARDGSGEERGKGGGPGRGTGSWEGLPTIFNATRTFRL